MSFTRHDRNNETTLRFDGSLDVLNTSELHGVIRELVAERPRRVTVDLTGLSLLDGSGVGALVSLCKGLRHAGTRVHAMGAGGQPLEIIKLLALGEFLGLAPGEPPASGLARAA